jgi:hypothetical protein
MLLDALNSTLTGRRNSYKHHYEVTSRGDQEVLHSCGKMDN